MARILLADDEESIVRVLEEHLSNMGHEVVGAADSGKMAVELAERFSPDLIIMDIMMPGELDGIDAAQIIRERLDIPALFLSAFADDHVVKKAKYVEPLGYLVKPFDANQLKAAIEVALYKSAMERKKRGHDQRDAWEEVARLARQKMEDLERSDAAPREKKPLSPSVVAFIVALVVLVLLMMGMAALQVIFKN